jgi:SAM-dependent methyltransferase
VPDESLDGLITVNTIYFVSDLQPALAEIRRVLRPDARAVIAVGDPERMAKLPLPRTASGCGWCPSWSMLRPALACVW